MNAEVSPKGPAKALHNDQKAGPYRQSRNQRYEAPLQAHAQDIADLQEHQGRAIAKLLALTYVETSVDVEWMWRAHDAWLYLVRDSFDSAMWEEMGHRGASKGEAAWDEPAGKESGKGNGHMHEAGTSFSLPDVSECQFAKE